MIVGRTKDFYLFDLLVYFLTSILKVTSWLQVQPSSRHSVQQESERRAGEQSTQPCLIWWESVAGGHQEDVTCLPTSQIWATGDFLAVPSPVPEMYILSNFHSGSSCQECSPGRTELLRPSGWAIWLNPIKYKVYYSGGPVGRSTLLPVLETNQVYVGLDKNFVWLVSMLFNKVIGENKCLLQMSIGENKCLLLGPIQ